MRYLLDVNALIAFGVVQHSLHPRTAGWVNKAVGKRSELLTCPITELGFVRILSRTAHYDLSFADARRLLTELARFGPVPFGFLPDDHGVSHLPGWVRTGNQTTDGHLVELARAHGAVLATLDRGIPGAFVIP